MLRLSRRRSRPLSVQSGRIEPDVSALERVQLPLAPQLENALEILLAPPLMALCLLSEFAVGGLSVARSSRHVCPLI